MPEINAAYTSPTPEHNKVCQCQIDFTGPQATDMKTLTTQLLSMKQVLNDHLTSVMQSSSATNGSSNAVEEDQEGEDEDEEDRTEKDGGMVKVTEPNDRSKRVKTN
jgi:hypothetical protein